MISIVIVSQIYKLYKFSIKFIIRCYVYIKFLYIIISISITTTTTILNTTQDKIICILLTEQINKK